MAATTADPSKGEGSLPASARSSEMRSAVGKPRGRGRRRDESQNDSGIELTQRVKGRNSKRREASPKVESPPKKARRLPKEVVPDVVAVGEKLAPRVARGGNTTKNKESIRKRKAANETSHKEAGEAVTAAGKRKVTRKKDAIVSDLSHESRATPSKKLRPRQSKKPPKYASDDDLFDDVDEDYAPSKPKRVKSSQENNIVKSETSDSGAEAESKATKRQKARPAKKTVQPRKMFTKPRRPNHCQAITATDTVKERIPGPSGITSPAHEKRLLLLARQMDGPADNCDESSKSQKASQESDSAGTSKEKAESEKARCALIMGMLKEHEKVAEMSDDSDDDDDDEEKNDDEKKPKKMHPTIEQLLPAAGENSKINIASGSEPVGKSTRRKPVEKKSIARKGKQSKKGESSSSDSDEEEGDWEVVNDATVQDPAYQRPDNVTVVLKNEDFLPDAKRLDMEQRMMRLINRRRKAVQQLGHSVHLLCLLAYQKYINSVVQDDTLRALALSRMPADLVLASSRSADAADSHLVKSILLFCKGSFEFTEPPSDGASFSVTFLSDKLRVLIKKRMTSCNIVHLLGVLLTMRAMGVPTRLCCSHRPMTHKPALLRRKDGEMVDVKPKATSSDEALGVLDYFAEVYLADWRCWRPIDIEDYRIIDDPHEMGAHLDQPFIYVVSIDAENAMTDLTPKYHSNWLSKGARLRPEGRFFEETLALYAPADDKKDHIEEQKEVADFQEKQGLPKTISEYKNHPKYALARHLLKFEAIYPRNADVLGYVNKEPVYRRECVKILRSKDTWHRHGRQVLEGEIAYNVVKARPKWDKRSEALIKDLPLEVFGEWQTEPYKPPVAQDGRVPRNKFGNVELFHDDMLPVGTVHLKLPGLNRIADELGIDCVPAVVGFEGVARGCHPVIEGFIVCVEHKETLQAAWREVQDEDRRKRRERIHKRALKNWRKIIKKVMWDNRLKKKYNSDNR